MHLHKRALELESAAQTAARPAPTTTVMALSSTLEQFDVDRNIALVSQFCETEVDSYLVPLSALQLL